MRVIILTIIWIAQFALPCSAAQENTERQDVSVEVQPAFGFDQLNTQSGSRQIVRPVLCSEGGCCSAGQVRSIGQYCVELEAECGTCQDGREGTVETLYVGKCDGRTPACHLIEEATTASCTWCADGDVCLDGRCLSPGETIPDIDVRCTSDCGGAFQQRIDGGQWETLQQCADYEICMGGLQGGCVAEPGCKREIPAILDTPQSPCTDIVRSYFTYYSPDNFNWLIHEHRISDSLGKIWQTFISADAIGYEEYIFDTEWRHWFDNGKFRCFIGVDPDGTEQYSEDKCSASIYHQGEQLQGWRGYCSQAIKYFQETSIDPWGNIRANTGSLFPLDNGVYRSVSVLFPYAGNTRIEIESGEVSFPGSFWATNNFEARWRDSQGSRLVNRKIEFDYELSPWVEMEWRGPMEGHEMEYFEIQGYPHVCRSNNSTDEFCSITQIDDRCDGSLDACIYKMCTENGFPHTTFIDRSCSGNPEELYEVCSINNDDHLASCGTQETSLPGDWFDDPILYRTYDLSGDLPLMIYRKEIPYRGGEIEEYFNSACPEEPYLKKSVEEECYGNRMGRWCWWNRYETKTEFFNDCSVRERDYKVWDQESTDGPWELYQQAGELTEKVPVACPEIEAPPDWCVDTVNRGGWPMSLP